MPYYPPRVHSRFRSPRRCGRAADANGVGTSASFECGCFVRVSVAVSVPEKMIRDARFVTNGCGYMAAAADVVAQGICGRELSELHSLDEKFFSPLAERELGPLPPERSQCLKVVLEATRKALSDFRSFLIEEFRGEKALICTCFGVSEETIENYISVNLPDTVEQVTAGCRAGGGCGSCRMLIQEMIDQHSLEI